MAIKRGLDGRFFIIKRPTNHTFISIIVKIPAFDKLSALARCGREEIDENHDQGLLNLRKCMFHRLVLMSPGR